MLQAEVQSLLQITSLLHIRLTFRRQNNTFLHFLSADYHFSLSPVCRLPHYLCLLSADYLLYFSLISCLQVIAAEGEQRASKALKEAADVISQSGTALQLRYLQTLNSIAAERNSTIVFPLPIDFMQALANKKS